MRICIQKSTGKLIEMQSAATEGTLIQNALSAGFSPDDIEEREITEAEWADPNAPWNKPTDAELQAQAEAKRQALFAEYDKKALQYQREVRLGLSGAEERLATWDAYAESLRAINNIEGWFRDPQWPVKPEV